MLKKIAILNCVALSFLLTGCASEPYWYKEGVSRHDTRSQYQDCVYNLGINKIEERKEARLIRACMEKEGFRLKR